MGIWPQVLLTDSEDELSPVSGTVFDHEVRKTCLIISPFLWNQTSPSLPFIVSELLPPERLPASQSCIYTEFGQAYRQFTPFGNT
jgi:hypothetical protein